MRILLVTLVLLYVANHQVFGSCVRYSDDFINWAGSNIVRDEEGVTGVPPPPTTPATEPPPPPSTTTEGPSTTTLPGPTGSTLPGPTGSTTPDPAPSTTTEGPSTSTTSLPGPATTTLPGPTGSTTPDAAPTTTPDPAPTTPTTPAPTTTTTMPPPTTTTPEPTTEDPYANYEYTKVVISGHDTEMGQVIFLRGGLDHQAYGCTDDPEACLIPIVHLLETADPSHRAWAEGDEYLDWGAETEQGAYDGMQAGGTPGYWEEGSWVFEFLMDCSRTDEGWFELKGYFQDYTWDYGYWEEWIPDQYECATHGNHQAVCGQENTFTWNQNTCQHN